MFILAGIILFLVLCAIHGFWAVTVVLFVFWMTVQILDDISRAKDSKREETHADDTRARRRGSSLS